MAAEIFRRPLTVWHCMIAVSLAIVLLLFVNKLFSGVDIQYLHLLVDYHFGFVKRALIGHIVSLFADRVSVNAVYAIGGCAWLAAFALFVAAFRRIYGLTREALPLLALLLASPMFLKNFMFNIGYFDIYGFILAAVALLLPVGALYIPGVAAAALALLTIHHLHFLLYLPTVFLIVVVRVCVIERATPARLVALGLAAAACAALFVKLAVFAAVPVPREVFAGYLQARAPEPFDEYTIGSIRIWYQPIAVEILHTWAIFHKNALRFPVYAAVIGLHWPVIVHFRDLLRRLQHAWHRRLMLAGIAGVTLGYCMICVVVFDYARWVAAWGVCMMLLMMTTRLLPSAPGLRAPPVADTKPTRVAGWIMAVLPRLGTTVPF